MRLLNEGCVRLKTVTAGVVETLDDSLLNTRRMDFYLAELLCARDVCDVFFSLVAPDGCLLGAAQPHSSLVICFETLSVEALPSAALPSLVAIIGYRFRHLLYIVS